MTISPVRNELPPCPPEQRIHFVCGRCTAKFYGFTDLVTHFEERHKQPALAAYVPKRFVNEPGLSAFEAGAYLKKVLLYRRT